MLRGARVPRFSGSSRTEGEGDVIAGFFADPHFGHSRILEMANRPFSTIYEHDEYLIGRYNASFSDDHVVVWLGDVSFYPLDRTAALISRMHGEKLCVQGNHDRSAAWLARAGFAVVPEVLLVIAGRTCRCSHYPYQHADRERVDTDGHDYPVRHNGELLIHGHTHKRGRVRDNMIHVGVDAWDWGPAPMAEVELLVAAMVCP